METQNEKTKKLGKVVYEKFNVHGQILRTQNCRREFVKKFTS